MKKYAILLGYFDKQKQVINKLYEDLVQLDVSVWELGYVFAMKTQQFYSATEDLLKQIAKAFENHVEDLSQYHRGLLMRLSTDIPNIRPRVLSEGSYAFLDKVRAFRHFVRHGYGCELDPTQLKQLQGQIIANYSALEKDFNDFRSYVYKLAQES